VPKKFGIANALLIARGMHIGVIALLGWLAFGFGLPWPAWAGIAVVAFLLGYEHSLVKADDLSKLDAAFFTVNGYISMLFLLFWGAAAAVWRVEFFDGFEMSELTITDQQLKPIADKVFAGERLSIDDGIRLYRSPDLLAVGWLANYVREKKHGNVTYFNVNRHINPTNICVAHCKLCAFGRDPNAPGAYNFSLEEIYARAEQGAREGALEFHIVGGLHPDLPFEYFWK